MSITDALSAVSILTAILTFFIGLAKKGIAETLKIEPERPGKVPELQEQRKFVRRILLLHGVPVSVGPIVLFYVCLPQTCDILWTSTFDYWHFDIIWTLFVLLEICLFVLVLLTSINMCRLIKLLFDIRKNLKLSPRGSTPGAVGN